MYYVYVLKSLIKNITYSGHTINVEERLKQHNNGNNSFTKKYKPWTIIYRENYDTEDKAIKREKYLKSAAGRRWMKKNIFHKV